MPSVIEGKLNDMLLVYTPVSALEAESLSVRFGVACVLPHALSQKAHNPSASSDNGTASTQYIQNRFDTVNSSPLYLELARNGKWCAKNRLEG